MPKGRQAPQVKRQKLPCRQLFGDLPLLLSSVTDEERCFFKEWCSSRNVGENYMVVAITYWLRCKSHAYASFFKFPEAKKIYLILCIHLTLKYMGYQEVYKCDFLADLREVYPAMTAAKHEEMEWELFRYLNFDLGS